MLVYLKKRQRTDSCGHGEAGAETAQKKCVHPGSAPSEKGLRFLQNLGFLPVTPPLQDMDIYEGTEPGEPTWRELFWGADQ